MRFGPVAVGLALALALGGCHSGPDERFAAEAARPADVVERVNAPGSVTAAAQAELTAAAAATVDQLPVRDGAKVSPGEVVARLTSSQVDESLRQAQAALASASSLGSAVPSLPTDQAVAALGEVQSQVTATSLAVITSLRSVAGTLPQPQRSRLNARLDQAERQLDQTRRRTNEAIVAAGAAVEAQTSALSRSLQAATAAQRAQAALAVEAAKSQKDRLTLRAPLAGTVQLGREQTGGGGGLPSLPSLPQGAEQALQGLTGGGGGQEGPVLRVGSEVDAGQVVATVYDVDSLDVTTEVDETDVALVRNGQRAEVELDAFPGARFEAHVRRVAVAPSSGTERSAAGGVTYQVDLALGRELEPGEDGRSALPRVGMTATAEIEVRHARNTLSVPGSALVGRGRGQSVYVIEDGRVRLRSVRVAADGDDRVAIASGLREGERVVSKGAERLRDGQTWPGS
ncbi:MAG TPA: efflux RND transporter periplasmic adaptor subunit [Actinomycetes bacterium]